MLAALALAFGLLGGPASVAAGTGPYRVKDINTSGDAFPIDLTEFNGKVYFAANGGGKGRELWMSDGSAPGTKRVKDIRPGPKGSRPTALAAIGGLLYFTADDGIHGHELWVSDGTASGTNLVSDIRPGADGSVPFGFIGLDGSVYFSADDSTHGRELWRTDGTNAGTWMVKDIEPGPTSSLPFSFVTFAGKVVFTTFTAVGNFNTLYKSNGTSAGTKPFLSTDGEQIVGRSLDYLNVIGGRLYFSATEPDVLWRSNGTASSTKVISPAGATETTGLGSTAFFGRGDELWKTAGTHLSTVLIKDIGVAPLYQLTDVNGTLFFLADNLLFKSDGTAPGTIQVDPVEVVLPNFGSPELEALGSTLYFAGPSLDSGDCHFDDFTLWRSDGTDGGTFEVSPTPSDCVMRELTSVAGSLFFAADDGAHGSELWRYVP